MKIIFLLGSLVSLLISINTYALDSCASFSPDYDKPTCEIARQLQDLNSKIDDTNRKLDDINSKLEEINSKVGTTSDTSY